MSKRMWNKKFLSILTFLWIFLCVLLSLNLTLRYVHNPSPFQHSDWDQRWLLIFGILTVGITLLYLLGNDTLLLWISIGGLLLFVIIPIFTMNASRPYFALSVIIVISLGIGYTFVSRFFSTVTMEGTDKLALSLLFGFSAIMVLRSIQAALGLLNPITTDLVLIILFVNFVFPYLRVLRDASRSFMSTLIAKYREKDYSPIPLVTGIFLILFFPSWLIALSPPMRYDEMTYHLAGPLFYLQQGKIVRFPEGGANPWLHYAEMLYTLAIELGGLSAARLIHYSMTLLSAVFAYLTAKHLLSRRAALISALAFLTIPLVAYEGATAYIDLFVTAYTTAFGYCCIQYWKDSNWRWVLVGGMLGGMGLGIKLSAAPMIFVILVCFGLLMVWERRFRQIPLLILAGGIAVLLAVPWWMRDYIWRGDPFFPYGIPLLQRLNSVQLQTIEGSRTTPSLLERLASYPIDIVLNSRKYYHEAPGAMTATLPFLSLPLWVLAPSIGKQAKKVLTLLIIASFVAIALMMIANNALLRYALPIFPWLAISAAANIEVVFRYSDERNNSWLGTVLFSLLMAFLFSTRPVLTLRIAEHSQRLPVSYFLGEESAEDYLQRNLPVYSAFQFIDSQPGGRHRVLSVGNEFRLYSYSRIDGVFDVSEAHELLISAQDGYLLAQRLLEKGYDYILLNRPEIEFVPWKYTYPILEQTDFLTTYCELVFADREIYVFQIHPKPLELPVRKNLLENPGFEDTAETDLTAWTEGGNTFIDSSAVSGDNSLRLYGPLSERYGWVEQTIMIEPGKIYTLSYWAKALGDNAVSLVKVSFLDHNQQLIDNSEFWKNVNTEWHQRTYHFSSPSNASYLRLVVSLGNYEGVLFDNFCLAQGQKCFFEEK